MPQRLCLLVLALGLGLPAIAQRHPSALLRAQCGWSHQCARRPGPSDSLTPALLEACLAPIRAQGYLALRVDSIVPVAGGWEAHIHKGYRYRWGQLRADSLSQRWLQRAGVNTARMVGRPIAPAHIPRVAARALRYLEDNGHPFARVQTRQAALQGGTIELELMVWAGPRIVLDTLYIKGDARVSRGFLSPYLAFQKGAPYNESQVAGYQQRLAALPFLTPIRPVEVEFIPGRARIYTYLTRRAANRFAGMVGFSYRGGERRGLELHGDLNLALHNSLGYGERLRLRWASPGGMSQRLEVEGQWPFLLGSQAGVDARFALLRHDTAYLNLQSFALLTVALGPGASVGVGLEHRSSRTLHAAAGASLADFRTTLYQAAFRYGAAVPPHHIQRNLWGDLRLGLGPRRVEGPGGAPGAHGELQGRVGATWPIRRGIVAMHLASATGLMGSRGAPGVPHAMLENELFRLGGMGSLRGFNQESILAQAYGLGTVELHWRLAQALGLYTLADLAYVYTPSGHAEGKHWPWALGLGALVQAAGGEVNLSYALGRGFGQRLRPREAMVHIGYHILF